MKKLILLFFLLVLLISKSFADSLIITSPQSGGNIYIPTGQSTINVEVCWTYEANGDVSFSLTTEQGTINNITSCYTVINVVAGSKSWSLKMKYANGAFTTTSVQFNVVLTGANITADNNFISGVAIRPPGITNPLNTHGEIKVDNINQVAPFSFSRELDAEVTLEAISPQIDNEFHQMIWHTGPIHPSDWRRDGVYKSPDQTYTFSVSAEDDGKTYTANLRKIYKVTFQNSFFVAGNSGIININGSQVNSPSLNNPVVEQNSITASPISQIRNGINYIFDHWNDGSTTDYRTFYPQSNTTYTAYFKGYASPQAINFGWDYSEGDPIQFHWTDNPNTGVTQYQIWRKVRHDGVTSDPVLLTTVNRGVQTYTDYDYGFIHNSNSDIIFYDIRQYYSLEQTYSSEYWHASYGWPLPKSNGCIKNNSDEIKEYALNCYPNPFNPATNISYQIKEKGHVLLKVYDILGKEVATLVNETQKPGEYNVSFNGTDLASGVYVYSLQVNNFVQNKKMTLMK